jgi:type IV secretion system protein VirD4
MAATLRLVGVGLGVALVWCIAATLGLVWLFGLWRGLDSLPVWAIPFQWFVYAAYYRDYYQVPQNLAFSGAAASILAIGLLVGNHTRTKEKKFLHGDSHWMTRREAYRAGFRFSLQPRPDAIVVGRWDWGPIPLYVSLPGEEHGALYARTRSGKGVGYVNPNLIGWGGSILAFSIKRDIVREAAAARAAMGDAVYVLDITAPDGRTHRWNPLGLVRRGTPDAHGDVQRVMFGIVPPTKANTPYWDNAARRIAVAASVLISETPGMALNVNEVRKLIGAADYEERIRSMIRDARVAKRPYPEAPVNTLQAWLDRKKEEGAAGVRETLTTAMQLWEDPRIQAATEVSDFDFSRIRSERMSIFVCAQPGDIRRLQLIYGIFFDAFVACNTRQEFREDTSHIHRALVKLDEFWALGKRDTLADAAAFTASYGFRVSYVLQSKSQVRGIFGEEGAKNLFLNTGIECVFGGTDQDTAKEISERAGFDTVTETTQSRPRFWAWAQSHKQSESDQARRRALIMPQEIARLSKDLMVVLRPGHMPMKLRRIVHYQDPYYKRLLPGVIGAAPELPRLDVPVEYDDGEAALAKEKAEQQAALDAIRAREEQAKAAEAEEAAQGEAKLAEITQAAAEAQALAQAAAEVEAMAEAESKQAAKEAAVASEAARVARAAATEANTAARRAKDALDSAIALGPPPPWISGAVPPADARAAAATEAARVAAEAAAEATEAARVARAGLTAAARDAKKARATAEKLAKYLASRGRP